MKIGILWDKDRAKQQLPCVNILDYKDGKLEGLFCSHQKDCY